ncbi:MAG: hypothetical protein HY823_05345 [Acidobacteria bacterium]|nr:hypothetical protein [Acidobacteriota bacterium]
MGAAGGQLRRQAPGTEPPPFQLLALTRAERHGILDWVHSALQEAGAFVTDDQAFSNAAACLHLECGAGRLESLHGALEALELHLDPARAAFLAPYENLPLDAPGIPVRGSLALAFFHTEPELRLPVPAVPG